VSHKNNYQILVHIFPKSADFVSSSGTNIIHVRKRHFAPEFLFLLHMPKFGHSSNLCLANVSSNYPNQVNM